jgi:hypothetical protein
MSDRNQNPNQPNPNQKKSPHPARDDQNWEESSGTGSSGKERSTEEPASVANDRGIEGRKRGSMEGDLDESQQESGMNDPVSGSDRDRDRGQNPNRTNR